MAKKPSKKAAKKKEVKKALKDDKIKDMVEEEDTTVNQEELMGKMALPSEVSSKDEKKKKRKEKKKDKKGKRKEAKTAREAKKVSSSMDSSKRTEEESEEDSDVSGEAKAEGFSFFDGEEDSGSDVSEDADDNNSEDNPESSDADVQEKENIDDEEMQSEDVSDEETPVERWGGADQGEKDEYNELKDIGVVKKQVHEDRNDNEDVNTTVVVGSIPFEADEQEFKAFLNEFDGIQEVRLPTFHDTGRLKGIAFIECNSQESSAALIQGVNGMEYGGRHLTARPEDPSYQKGERKRYEGGNQRDEAVSLFIGNLSFDATEEELRQVFSAFGNVTRVKIVTDRDTGRSRGFGYVDYNELSEAEAALQSSELSIHGRWLKVDHAQRGGASNRGGGRGGRRDDRGGRDGRDRYGGQGRGGFDGGRSFSNRGGYGRDRFEGRQSFSPRGGRGGGRGGDRGGRGGRGGYGNTGYNERKGAIQEFKGRRTSFD